MGVLESISQWESDIKSIEERVRPAQPKKLDVNPEWWNIYGRFEGRLFRPEPASVSIEASRD